MLAKRESAEERPCRLVKERQLEARRRGVEEARRRGALAERDIRGAPARRSSRKQPTFSRSDRDPSVEPPQRLRSAEAVGDNQHPLLTRRRLRDVANHIGKGFGIRVVRLRVEALVYRRRDAAHSVMRSAGESGPVKFFPGCPHSGLWSVRTVVPFRENKKRSGPVERSCSCR